MGRAKADTRMDEPASFFERHHLACRARNEISQLEGLPP
jgi:hypothetical protein